MSTNGHRRPEEIQADIERTRTELDQTLSAIERRLSPGELVDQGLDYLRHSGARQYVANLGRSAKDDPLPLALVGVGLAWLMMSNGRSRDPVATTTHDIGASAASVKHKLAATTQGVVHAAHAARERASAAGESARRQAERIRGGYDYLVHEQPLAFGAIGLALGAVLAAVAPRTRQEDQLMGSASDRLGADAKEAGKEHLDKAKHAATAAKDAARDSLERDYGEGPARDGEDAVEKPQVQPYAPYGPGSAT